MYKCLLVAAIAIVSATLTNSSHAGLRTEYKKGQDPDVSFSTEWTKKNFVKQAEKYLQNNTLDDLAAKFEGLVDPSKNYDPFSSKTWLDAKYGSDLRLVFKDQKNVFVVKFDGKRLYRFDGPDDAPVQIPGPEAGAGLAGLAMAGIGAYALRRRKQIAA